MTEVILVTGGAGFIGANFVHHIIKNTEHNVIILDSLTYAGNLNSLKDLDTDRITFVHGNVCDRDLVLHQVEKSDAVVHFAAESHLSLIHI